MGRSFLRNRLLHLICAIALVIGLVPLPALAEVAEEADAPVASEAVNAESAPGEEAPTEAGPDKSASPEEPGEDAPSAEPDDAAIPPAPAQTPALQEPQPAADQQTPKSDSAQLQAPERITPPVSQQALERSGVQDDSLVLASGTFDTGVTWEYRDNATLTFQGEGAIPDFPNRQSQPWNSYLHRIEKIVIGEGITEIGDYSFYDCVLLGTYDNCITWPTSSLERIGAYAFSSCDKIKALDIPDSVQRIDQYAFSSCPLLASCHLPTSLTEISDYLFASDYQLQYVNIPEGVTRIGISAFDQYYTGTDPRVGIKNLVFPASLKAIDQYAFRMCFIDSDLTIPATVERLSTSFWGSFDSTRISGTLTFEENVREGVAADGQFSSASARIVELPASVSTAAPRIATDEYVVAVNNPNYQAIGGVLYSRVGDAQSYDSKTAILEAIPANRAGTYEVPEGTKEVKLSARLGAVTTLVLPASLELVIGDPQLNYQGGLKSQALQNIEVREDNPRYASEDGVLFSKDKTKLLRCPSAHAFAQGAYRIPAGVTSFARYAFDRCSNLRSLHVADGATSLPGCFISSCTNLICLYLPDSIATVDRGAFSGSFTRGLTVFYGGTQSAWGQLVIERPDLATENKLLADADKYYNALDGGEDGEGLLYYLDKNKTLHIVPNFKVKVDELQTTVPDQTLPQRWSRFADTAEAVSFSNRITAIGNDAFSGFREATRAVLPESVTSVGQNAFADCPKLTRVECQGNPLASVCEKTSATPSFGENATICCYQGAGWTESSDYDAATHTWSGYPLLEEEPLALPEIGSMRFQLNGETVDSVTVAGKLRQQNTTLSVTVFSTEGEDITDSVSLSVMCPKRTVPLVGAPLPKESDCAAHIGADGKSLVVGYCALAGAYEIAASPRAFQAGGDAKTFSLTVNREPSRLRESWWHGQRILSGRTSSDLAKPAPISDLEMDVWDQYNESVLDKCTMQLFDETTGLDVTDTCEAQGIYLDALYAERMIRYSELALPHSYSVRFKSDELENTCSGTFGLYRNALYLNVPFSITLAGGDEAIVKSDEDQWASKPYRVRVLDRYDDPVWPSLAWKVTDSKGIDVTSYFEVDEQGYLHTKNAGALLASYGNDETFKITASAQGRSGIITSNALDIRFAEPVVEAPPVTHTATFMVGDEEIGKVVFTEGDASLKEPPLPERKNYTGAWEPYDLKSATGDIVIRGIYKPLNPDEVSEVETSGDASYENGEVAITLSASAASRQVRVESQDTKPVDVVLVLDQSGSMAETLGANQTKRDALANCATTFVSALQANAVKTGADHRVALVGFANGYQGSGDYPPYLNTGLLATANGGAQSYKGGIKASVYQQALIPVSVNGALNPRVTQGLNAIASKGATAADLGLKMARDIFSANPASSGSDLNRERVVVFITDGTPTSWSTSESERSNITTTAAEAISMANDLKQSKGVHIYAIGVDGNADPAAAFTLAKEGLTWQNAQGSYQYDFNRFLHLISSNFPEATSMDNHGEGSREGGYYMAVNKTDNLSSIFTNIMYSTVYSVETFDNVTLSYTLPSSFALTMKQEEEMRARLAEQGLSEDDIIVGTNDAGQTTLTFRNVKALPKNVDGIERYVASVSFTVSADKDASGSVSAGSASGSVGGQVSEIDLGTVSVPADRCLVVFKLNDAVYEIRDLEKGEAIAIPETDLARWLSLEKLENPTASEPYAIFETSTLTRDYLICWKAAGLEMTQRLAPGATVEVPAAIADAVPADSEIVGWSPALPVTMPTRNITCFAVISPKHQHDYSYRSYHSGSCETGIVTHRVCVCGEETAEQAAPKAHAYRAHLSAQTSKKETTVEYLECSDCGNQIEKNLTYTVAQKPFFEFGSATVIDLSKYENEVVCNGASSDNIELRFYVGDSLSSSRTYSVTRIDPDGTRTTYETRVQDGYLVFDPDHFSIYVIGEAPAGATSNPADALTYQDALDALAAPDTTEPPAGVPDSPALTPDEPSDPSEPVDPSDPSEPADPSGNAGASDTIGDDGGADGGASSDTGESRADASTQDKQGKGNGTSARNLSQTGDSNGTVAASALCLAALSLTALICARRKHRNRA